MFKRIIYVGELIRTPDAYDHRGIIQGLTWLKEDKIIDEFKIVDPILNGREEIIRQCNEFEPDLIIHGNTDSLSNGTIPFINGFQVFFMGDCRTDGYQFWNEWVENGRGFLKHIFISNYDQLSMWNHAFDCPASFWPHGCYVPDRLENDPKFAFDVVFIGTMNTDPPFNARVELIREIERLLPVPISFINGSGVEGRNKIWRDMAKIYHSSKIVLDISHFWHLDGYASGRYWYSAGLGGCCVTKRFPRCEEFYKDKIHKLYFDEPREAVEIIKTYLQRLEGRELIKMNAYEHNKLFHNYKVRFKQMFKILNAQKQ